MRERLKRCVPPSVIKRYQTIRSCCIRLWFVLFRLFPIKRNRVVFCNVWGYGDSPKYIAEALLRNKSGLELIFITNRSAALWVPKGIKAMYTNSPKAIHALSTAKIWVDCNRKEPYIKKRRKQYYIQTWHGGLALKRIEGDCPDYLGDAYIQNAKRDSAMADLYLSNGRACTNMYHRAFWYRGEIMECGTPRNDILLHPDDRRMKRTRKRMNIPPECKFAIYAPTYRAVRSDGTKGYQAVVHEAGEADPRKLDFHALREALAERFGGIWMIVLRLHPLVSAGREMPASRFVRDGNRYPDLYELMEAADLVITDYSNIMFEFTLTKRPVFLYAPDLYAYEWDRGFYYPYAKLPFPKAYTETELTDAIINYRIEDYEAGKQDFLEHVGFHEEGDASIRAAERVMHVAQGN